MFGLCVRFTCKDPESAEGFDKLVAETVQARPHEPGTVVYAVHAVEGSRWSGFSTSCTGTRRRSTPTRHRRTPAGTSPSATSTWQPGKPTA